MNLHAKTEKILHATTNLQIPSATTKRLGAAKKKKKLVQELPGGPVAKTLCSQCREPGFDPWTGNWIPHAATEFAYRH